MNLQMTPADYQTKMAEVFTNLKHGIADGNAPMPITVTRGVSPTAVLEPVICRDVHDFEAVSLLSRWREANWNWFPAKFPVTDERTKRWLLEQVIDKSDRLLFWIKSISGMKIGHIGFYRVNSLDYSCEIDNVLHGRRCDEPRGVMTDVLRTLIDWSQRVLGNRALELTVFADNARAIALYERCGFQTSQRIPLKKVVEGEVIQWEELPVNPGDAERYNLKMRIVFSNPAK